MEETHTLILEQIKGLKEAQINHFDHFRNEIKTSEERTRSNLKEILGLTI